MGDPGSFLDLSSVMATDTTAATSTSKTWYVALPHLDLDDIGMLLPRIELLSPEVDIIRAYGSETL